MDSQQWSCHKSPTVSIVDVGVLHGYQSGVLPSHVHVCCRPALPGLGMIHASCPIVLMLFATPVQRSACGLKDDPVLDVPTTFVLGKHHLCDRVCCTTARAQHIFSQSIEWPVQAQLFHWFDRGLRFEGSVVMIPCILHPILWENLRVFYDVNYGLPSDQSTVVRQNWSHRDSIRCDAVVSLPKKYDI